MTKLHNGYRLKFPKFILQEGFNLISGQHLYVEIEGSYENETPVELTIIALEDDTVELHVKEIQKYVKEDEQIADKRIQNIDLKDAQKIGTSTSVVETVVFEKGSTSNNICHKVDDEHKCKKDAGEIESYTLPQEYAQDGNISQDYVEKNEAAFTKLAEAGNIIEMNGSNCVRGTIKIEVKEEKLECESGSHLENMCDDHPCTKSNSQNSSFNMINDDTEMVVSNDIDTNNRDYNSQDKGEENLKIIELNQTECTVLKSNEIESVSDDLHIIRDENGRYSCFLCSKKVLNLLTHIQFMHKNTPMYGFLMKVVRKKLKNSNKCEHCSVVFKTFYDLSRHMIDMHNSNSDINGLHDLQKLERKSNEDLICERCQIVFKSEYLLNRHLKHECGIKFYCDQCTFICKTSKCLRKHVQNHHAFAWTEPYNCEHCCKKLKNIFGLYRHVLINHKDLPNYQSEINRLRKEQTMKCPKCPVTLQWRNMKQHIISAHTSKNTSVKCKECGVILKNIDILRIHVKNIHETLGKKFPCSECGNSFRTRQLLAYHMKNVHANPEVVYKCDECEYTTSSKKYLKNHCSQKHVPANYMCGECGRCFKTSDKLKRHNLLIHNPEKIETHSCVMCNKKFQLKSNLNKHVKTVHFKNYSYTCDLCDLRFHSKKMLTQHYKRKHDGSMPRPNEMQDRIKQNTDKVIKTLPQKKYENQAIPYDEKISVLKRSVPQSSHSNRSDLPTRQLLPKIPHDKYSNVLYVIAPNYHGSHNNTVKTRTIEQTVPAVEDTKVQSLFLEDKEIMYQEQEVSTLSETHATD